MILKTEVIKLPIKKERVKDILIKLTDDNFNGKNEDCEKVSLSLRGKEILMCKLDSWMFEYDYKKDDVQFLQAVLDDAYSKYAEKEIEVILINKNTIFVVVVYK